MVITVSGEEKLYAEIGRTISTWAVIEEQVFKVFTAAAGQPAAICATYFYILRNFSDQLKLTNTLFRTQTKFTNELAFWDRLEIYTAWLASHRNFVAHHAINRTIFVPREPKKRTSIFVTQAPRGEANPYGAIKPPRTFDDLHRLTDALNCLLGHYLAFNRHLSGQHPSPERFHASFVDPILQGFDPGLRKPKKS